MFGLHQRFTLQVLYLGFNRITDISALCLERMPRLLAVDLQVIHLDR